jgi:hypothetical protein
MNSLQFFMLIVSAKPRQNGHTPKDASSIALWSTQIIGDRGEARYRGKRNPESGKQNLSLLDAALD